MLRSAVITTPLTIKPESCKLVLLALLCYLRAKRVCTAGTELVSSAAILPSLFRCLTEERERCKRGVSWSSDLIRARCIRARDTAGARVTSVLINSMQFPNTPDRSRLLKIIIASDAAAAAAATGACVRVRSCCPPPP